jgi:hypothetical protein
MLSLDWVNGTCKICSKDENRYLESAVLLFASVKELTHLQSTKRHLLVSI